MDIAFQVVYGDGHEEFNIWFDQLRSGFGEIHRRSTVSVKRRRDGQFNRVGSLVNPLFVEGETSAHIFIGTECRIGDGEVLHGLVSDPYGIGCEILYG